MSEDVQEVKKIGFFKKVIKSIKDFDKYEDFAIERLSESIKYFLKIMAIFAAIISIVYTYKIITNANNIYYGLKDKIPEFTYENGELTADSEEATIIEDYSETLGSIIIDTKIESNDAINEYSNQINKYGSGIIFLKNGFVITNSNINRQIEYKYTDILSVYNVTSGTKGQLVNYIDNLNMIYVYISVFLIIFVYLYIAYVITTIIDILLLAALTYVSSRLFRIKFKFLVNFNISVHAITLPIILNLIYIIINVFTAFQIKYFQIMYYTIAYIYIIVAILMIKTDLINRQAELIKMAKEQMKIKEELEKQEEEEKEKQKKDKEEDKKNKKETEDENKPDKKEKNKKKDKTPDEPIGDASIIEK